MKVIVTDQVFPALDVERRILHAIDADLEVLSDSSPDSIKANARDADAILTTYAPISADIIASLQRCKVIARYGIGVDNIDLQAARDRGIAVTNVPDYCVEEVADHAIALLLTLARKITIGNRVVRGGGWSISDLRPVLRLRGRTLGLIGFGHIGRAVSVRALVLGLNVTVFDPLLPDNAFEDLEVSRATELGGVLSSSDFVSIHAPLTDTTRGMIDSAAIDRMPSGAVLINTSRGPIVNTAAVVRALRSGHLGGAGLDVFDTEPPDADVLKGVENLVATPHSAFYSEQSIEESQTKAAEAILAVLQGKEPRYRIV
jgi:D-3-phosphoglycerate dehydrogenase